MDPMCPLPKKGDFLQGQTWTDCNYVLLLNFAPYMKETSLFWLYRPVMFLLFGVEAGVSLFYDVMCVCVCNTM